MTSSASDQVWRKILENMEEKLQLGLLEQTRGVASAAIEGSTITLRVATPEAAEFFAAHVNQQRLIILARPIVHLERVVVESA